MALGLALGPAPDVVVHPLATSDFVEDVVYSLFVVLIGIALVWYGFHRHRQRRLMTDTATSEVESAAVGAVELTGTVERAAGTVTAPLTAEECVVVDYEVEEYKRHDDLAKEWVTVDSAVVAEPFYLNDGTGRMLVDPPEWSSNYDVSEENRRREGFDSTAAQPDALDAFLVDHTGASPTSGYPRRYTQEVIPVGSEAFVFGDAESAEDVEVAVDLGAASAGAALSDLVVTEDEDTEMFLLSDKRQDELVAGRRYSLVAWGIVGVGVFSLGLWWFLDTIGV